MKTYKEIMTRWKKLAYKDKWETKDDALKGIEEFWKATINGVIDEMIGGEMEIWQEEWAEPLKTSGYNQKRQRDIEYKKGFNENN